MVVMYVLLLLNNISFFFNNHQNNKNLHHRVFNIETLFKQSPMTGIDTAVNLTTTRRWKRWKMKKHTYFPTKWTYPYIPTFELIEYIDIVIFHGVNCYIHIRGVSFSNCMCMCIYGLHTYLPLIYIRKLFVITVIIVMVSFR